MTSTACRLATVGVAAMAAVGAIAAAPTAQAGSAAPHTKTQRLTAAPHDLRMPGTSKPPGGYASWADLMAVQERLDKAADRIVASNGAGYAGIVVSAEKRKLTVYWHGTPTGRAKSALDSARKNVAVSVVPAAHSLKTLQSQARQVARTSGVTSVTPAVDGSRLDVTVSAGTSRSAVQTRLKAGRQSELRSGVPLRVTRDAAAPKLASRGNDSPPYWGGARWNGCSNGFAVRVGASNHMLSAGHCGANGQAAFDGGGDFMGSVYGDNNAADTLLVSAPSSGRIYDGGVGVGEFSKPVIGALHSFVGDWLCDSGAYSGARCGIQVKATGVTINVGYLIFNTVRAEQVDHTNAIGNGDSGGPVFSLASWDFNKVWAKGINSAIDLSTSVPCTGVPAGGGRSCAWRMYYVDVVNALNSYGAGIVTG
jgi:hypothetical protein